MDVRELQGRVVTVLSRWAAPAFLGDTGGCRAAGLHIKVVHDDINFELFSSKSFLAPRKTLNYNPEESKIKISNATVPPRHNFWDFLKISKVLGLRKCPILFCLKSVSGNFKKKLFSAPTDYFQHYKN